MPNPTTPQGANQPADLTLKLRTIIAAAYDSVVGQQQVQSFSAITLEELAAQEIDRLSGKGTNGRPNALQQIQRIANDLQSVASQIMNTPPSAFLLPDPNNDVNTPVNPGG